MPNKFTREDMCVKEISISGLKPIRGEINLFSPVTCGKCGKIYYIAFVGRRKGVKVVEVEGRYEPHRYHCLTK